MSRAYYEAPIYKFLEDDPSFILGQLAISSEFALEDLQRNAWLAEIAILKKSLQRSSGHIYFEFAIPRMGKRADVVVLSQGVIFILEFKVWENKYSRDALDQVLDYALDLKNFHSGSHSRSIVPILVATAAPSQLSMLHAYEDCVYAPLLANEYNLDHVLLETQKQIESVTLDPIEWQNSPYKPTPTIVEAAQALYSGHSVREISRSDAGAYNLTQTSDAILDIIHAAKSNHQKAICFVTGVPGAGKTLAGLNIANSHLQMKNDEHAVFLSGNGPLVEVLREALARNEVAASAENNNRLSKKQALTKARAFIQNIHHFRDDALQNQSPPTEKVVIFDEAQRAWTRQQTSSFMKRKKNVANFAMSEPEFLISVMDRHPDWAVIISLIGGGQEINTGEAGLAEWFSALKHRFPHWKVAVSPNISDSEYTNGRNFVEMLSGIEAVFNPNLHLAVSVRSFRSEKVSGFVKALLDVEIDTARRYLKETLPTFPIVLTRNLDQAKNWLRSQARGTERYGLLASSGGHRLRPIGLNVQDGIDVTNWFLNSKEDVRSSYALEQVATEFDIQGLELDWTCVAWDADLSRTHSGWSYRNFIGSKWQNVKDSTRQLYLKNAYRVLLTRARQGMVIFVPHGDEGDPTRPIKHYDSICNYLYDIGLPEI